ncbi:SWIM-type domain-containing protein [Aphis craccivora]|uniref:SWIM-type domain-containing protein n=1 Tax=Aphis craccivora TaxID=307492 RepID=A0A6G0WMD8_APHCR|nr:SWIM-type domain-containing protein [Aphis craccivora]
MRWNVRITVPNGTYYIQCKKNYVCHHSSHHKVDRTLNKRVKIDTVSNRKSDHFVKVGKTQIIHLPVIYMYIMSTKEVPNYYNNNI